MENERNMMCAAVSGMFFAVWGIPREIWVSEAVSFMTCYTV